MDTNIIEKVAEFIKNLRASGHSISGEETLLKALGVELSDVDRATLFKALEQAQVFRPDNGIWLCFQDFDLKVFQEAAKSTNPGTEFTTEVKETLEAIDPLTFKPDGVWIVTTDSSGKRHRHFQWDKSLTHSNEAEPIIKVRDENNGESHLDFDL